MLDAKHREALLLSSVEAAIAAYSSLGAGNSALSDRLATDAMRKYLSNSSINGKVVIGEGERDAAPMLEIGEQFGKQNNPIDIAVDPLEGTEICAKGGAGALSVIAAGAHGSLLAAPDLYMEKFAIGFNAREQIIDLNLPLSKNLERIALAKKCRISELSCALLDRPRHAELIKNLQEFNIKITLIGDGDVAAIMKTSNALAAIGVQAEKFDFYIGTGGAPEGVLAACYLRAIGAGQMAAKLKFKAQSDRDRAAKMGIEDFNRQYFLNDMAASQDVMFAVTGVSGGDILAGIKEQAGYFISESLFASVEHGLQKITMRRALSN